MMLKGTLYGITASAIWGGMYVVSDVVLTVIPPFTLLTLRLVLGMVALLPFALRLDWASVRRPAAALPLLGMGLVGFGLSFGAQFIGTDLSTAIHATLITSASPAFILLFGTLLLREALTGARVLAVLLASVGVVVIVNPAHLALGGATLLGDLALAVAALTWGLYSVLVRHASRSHHTLIVTLVGFVGGLLLTVPASLVELQARTIGPIDVPVVLGVLYLGVVSTAGAMWLWNRAFALVPAARGALFFFAQPLVGVLLSVVLLGQAMTAGLWVGSALIVLGVLLALVGSPRKAFEQMLAVLRYNR